MLSHLQIRDLLLIEDLSVDFSPGFNALTGETGAGKSLVVTSLDLLLGKRGTSDLVRRGADSAEVEGLFLIADDSALQQRLDEAGFPADDELLIRRVIPADGRHRCYINGRLASLGVLAQLAADLANVMGQHEHHSLSVPEVQMNVLDDYGHHAALRADMHAAWQLRKDAETALADLIDKAEGRAAKLDYIAWQLRELEDLAPTSGEFETLTATLQRLRHQSLLLETAERSADHLYESDNSAFAQLGRVQRSLEEASRYDPDLHAVASQVDEAAILIEEASRTLSAYARRLDADPAQLETLEARSEALKRLMHKHATDEAGLLALQASLQREQHTLESYSASLEGAQQAVEAAAQKAQAAAHKLTTARRTAAQKMGRAVKKELAALSFAKADFLVDVQPAPGPPGIHGADQVEFRVALNPGEGVHNLRRVASGGELSRLMLALKRVLAGMGPVGTYVFDEVDAGIGGAVAVAVGQKLKEVARHHQVICITHLPQIAALADSHFHVAKHEKDGRTRSAVAKLDDEQRVQEIARMLGGDAANDRIRAAAEELIRAT